VRPGNHWNQPHEAAVRVITQGLVKLGLLKGSVSRSSRSRPTCPFFNHRTGHWLGLDVHDVGDYKVGGEWRVLEAGMALTVEPGIYIRPSAARAQGILEHRHSHRGRCAGNEWRGGGADRRAGEDPEAIESLVSGRVNAPYDLAIVGGGMVGASLAVALARLGVRIALIEAVPHDSARSPASMSAPRRSRTAAGASSRPWASGRRCHPRLHLLRKIHVSDRGGLGSRASMRRNRNLAAMGYVVPNRALGAALWAPLARSADVTVFCPAQVRRVTPGAFGDAGADGGGRRGLAGGTLVVAADGAQSAVRAAFGVEAEVRDYERRRSSPPSCRNAFMSTWPTSGSPTRVRWRCCRLPMDAAPWC
jgi:hypothetical protein